MKLTYRNIAGFLNNPDPEARVILVYGPDHGLVRERAELLGRKQVQDLNDPFNVVSLTPEQLAEDPARLHDEANAISMMGGNRLIQIKDGADKLTALLKPYLDNPSRDTLIVIEAGELSPRSSLRALCERAANAAALPCYVEDERDLSGLISDIARHAGYAIDRDALQYCASALVGDRGRVRAEMDKLITYMGQDPDYQGPQGDALGKQIGTIRIEDAQASIGDAAARTLDDVIMQAGSGQAEPMLRSFSLLQAEGMPVIAVLRALQNHFRRLQLAQTLIESGLMPKDALKKLSPPVFFKQEQAFLDQLRRWNSHSIDNLLVHLAEIEAQCKQTGTPDYALTGQTLCQIALKAQRAA